ncbi:uncharacterized protein BYT42DRAFT_333243 [Radiomyces spectabilis]|uniref:uncharacterized protein n=1 Tax=Radiomyces spectabilis TaxID=64574 RepID=UPI00221F9073|nr:uncharacterized protein BYT42DRAFT_333243 [Radiomyces spectabilis]KAI8379608.1 hypothetical protein BYT42DRAFT_333243 [Radiomyces spectabilis]
MTPAYGARTNVWQHLPSNFPKCMLHAWEAFFKNNSRLYDIMLPNSAYNLSSQASTDLLQAQGPRHGLPGKDQSKVHRISSESIGNLITMNMKCQTTPSNIQSMYQRDPYLNHRRPAVDLYHSERSKPEMNRLDEFKRTKRVPIDNVAQMISDGYLLNDAILNMVQQKTQRILQDSLLLAGPNPVVTMNNNSQKTRLNMVSR